MTETYVFRISKEDYERGLKEGAESLISEEIRSRYVIDYAEITTFFNEYLLSYGRTKKG